jgi:hypothetical protein
MVSVPWPAGTTWEGARPRSWDGDGDGNGDGDGDDGGDDDGVTGPWRRRSQDLGESPGPVSRASRVSRASMASRGSSVCVCVCVCVCLTSSRCRMAKGQASQTV